MRIRVLGVFPSLPSSVGQRRAADEQVHGLLASQAIDRGSGVDRHSILEIWDRVG
jgi:hypothetical protein